jgi:hypothetical protein
VEQLGHWLEGEFERWCIYDLRNFCTALGEP